MLNAPESALEAICELVPGSRAPSIVPLTESGMVAVHALVPAGDVWRLLPQLEAAGGSSILLLPVERMLA
jgi:ATP phosphoribosyltransferase